MNYPAFKLTFGILILLALFLRFIVDYKVERAYLEQIRILKEITQSQQTQIRILTPDDMHQTVLPGIRPENLN